MPPDVGSPTPAPAPEPEPLPPGVARFANDSEYYHPFSDAGFGHYSLRSVRAAWAYDHIQQRYGVALNEEIVVPGTGVNIAVVDTGIDLDHWEFEGARLSVNDVLACCGGPDDEFAADTTPYHGTAVTSVIVAQRDNPPLPADKAEFVPLDFHGLAWGATVKVFPIFIGSVPPGDYDPITIEELRMEDPFEAGYLREILNDPDIDFDIVNMSFGVPGLIENYNEVDLRDALDDFIQVAEQSGVDPSEKTLLVRAAGNDHLAECERGDSNCDLETDVLNDEGEVVGQRPALDASSPTVLGGLPVRIEELRDHWVVVVATYDGDGVNHGPIAEFSNSCGVAAKWCIAAPGASARVAGSAWRDENDGSMPVTEYIERTYNQEQGTSFSAPMVAAGLALVMQRFRDQLGNGEVLKRLLETAVLAERPASPDIPAPNAPDYVPPGGQCPEYLDLDDDLSDCELSSAIGHGVMDLDAATRPVGSVSVMLGETVAGARAPASTSLLRGGAAFGDGLASAMRGRELAVFDELGAPFWIDLGGFAAPAARPGLAERLQRLMAPAGGRRGGGGAAEIPFASGPLRMALDRAGADDAWGGGHMSLVPLADGGLSLTGGEKWQVSAFAASRQFGRDAAGPARAAAGTQLAWKPDDGPLGARLGVIHEFESAAGARAAGAFGDLASDTAFAGADIRAGFRGWSLLASAELGLVDVRSRPGLVQGVSPLTTSALTVSGERALSDGGLLRLSLSRPLRVERGRLKLSIPTGRDRRGGILREAVEAPLRPSGQQIDVAALYRRPAGGGELRLGSTLSLQPGHAAGSDPELSVLAGWRLSF